MSSKWTALEIKCAVYQVKYLVQFSAALFDIKSPSSDEAPKKKQIAWALLHCNIHANPCSLAASAVHFLLVILKVTGNCCIQALSQLKRSWW